MNGMPSENVDELDRRVMELQKKYEDLQHCFNLLFAETRDVLKAYEDSKKSTPEEEGCP